jgi:hypothetical protein
LEERGLDFQQRRLYVLDEDNNHREDQRNNRESERIEGRTSNSKLAKKRVRPPAAASPMANPSSTGLIP